jgi:hypothetical protein
MFLKEQKRGRIDSRVMMVMKKAIVIEKKMV